MKSIGLIVLLFLVGVSDLSAAVPVYNGNSIKEMCGNVNDAYLLREEPAIWEERAGKCISFLEGSVGMAMLLSDRNDIRDGGVCIDANETSIQYVAGVVMGHLTELSDAQMNLPAVVIAWNALREEYPCKEK